MHLLGNVRGGEVHYDLQLSWERRGTHTVNKKVRDELRDKGRLERDVDKTRPSYFTSTYELLVVTKVRCNLSSHISRGNILTLALQQLIEIVFWL